MFKAHKIKLYPTKLQEALLRKSCGVARHSYNWALGKWKELYETGEKPSAYYLVKLQNSIKRQEMPFYLDVSKTAPELAIHHLESAFKKMWREGKGYPKFKKKGVRDSFVAIANSSEFRDYNLKIHVPRIGKIKCSESLRFNGRVTRVTISRVADMWFAVINVDIPNEIPSVSDNQVAVGIDFGIKSMMVLSDGTIYENPKALKSKMKGLNRLQRGLSRKMKGGKNRYKQQMKVAKKHYQISCIRNNAIHKATSEIVKMYDKIIIETLKPLNMVKNRKLSQAIGDVSFGEISRQLAYKAQWAGKELVKADQWFASSKICSNCGNKKEKLSLGERTYKCDNCGFVCDRDLNAAINLANYSPTSKIEGSKACGAINSSLVTKKRVAMKQEVDNFVELSNIARNNKNL